MLRSPSEGSQLWIKIWARKIASEAQPDCSFEGGARWIAPFGGTGLAGPKEGRSPANNHFAVRCTIVWVALHAAVWNI
jgi:hypothetical protein